MICPHCGTTHPGRYCPDCGRSTGSTVVRVLLSIVVGFALTAASAVGACGVTIVVASATSNDSGFLIGLAAGVVAFAILMYFTVRLLIHMNRK